MEEKEKKNLPANTGGADTEKNKPAAEKPCRKKVGSFDSLDAALVKTPQPDKAVKESEKDSKAAETPAHLSKPGNVNPGVEKQSAEPAPSKEAQWQEFLNRQEPDKIKKQEQTKRLQSDNAGEPKHVAGGRPKEQICSFWKRIGAWVMDGALLWLIGMGIVLVFSPLILKMGHWAMIIGLVISMYYYGTYNSEIKGGQTPGKKHFQIKVVGEDGQCIPHKKALLRTFILALPWYTGLYATVIALGGINALTIIGQNLIFFVATVIGVGLVYFYLFNKPTRQSFHDLICKTYVVNHRVEAEIESKPVWKWHYVIFGGITGMLVIVFLVFTVIALTMLGNAFSSLSLQKRLGKLNHVTGANVMLRQSIGVGAAPARQKSIVCVLEWAGPEKEEDKAVSKATRILLKRLVNPQNRTTHDLDSIIVIIRRSYNIGIFSFNFDEHHPFDLNEWRKEMEKRLEERTD